MTDVDTIKQRVDCRALLASYGVRFATGAAGNARCWHDSAHTNGDRSASVQVHRDGFKCHGCGAFGDVFDVVQWFDGVDFKTARQTLAEIAGIDGTPTPYKPRQGRNAAARQGQPAQVQPPAIEPIRREVLGRVWDCLVFAEQPAALFEYGAARGVSREAMQAAGVRDWTAAAAEVVAVIRDGFTRAELQAAGVLKTDGQPWFPFAEVRDIAAGTRAAASGFVVPVFDGESSAPVAMRWRYYNPHGRVKALAQPSGAPLLPIGLDSLTRARAGGKPYIVIACEGETDWLAAIDAARVAGINAAVLSHCTMSTVWRPEWSAMMSDAAAVIIGFDEGKPPPARDGEEEKRPAGVERAAEIVNQLGKTWLDRIAIEITREGGNDFADLHKNGQLAPLIERLAANAEQATHTQQQQAVEVM